MLHSAHEGCKVGLDAGAIHQLWSDDENLHACIGAELAQTLLGFVLTQAVGILRVGYIGLSECSTGRS